MTSEIAPAGEGREPAAVDRELRASYEDRDKVAELLRVAAGDGRLTADELEQRLEAALTARTYRELAALTADLPGVARVEPDVPVARPQRAVARIEVASASLKREGHWDVPRQLEVRVGSGKVVLDFTQVTVSDHWKLLIVKMTGAVLDAPMVAMSVSVKRGKPSSASQRSSAASGRSRSTWTSASAAAPWCSTSPVPPCRIRASRSTPRSAAGAC